MMRYFLLLAALVCMPSVLTATKSSEAIIRVLNTRNAASEESYLRALEIVAADAKAGKPIQQFLIALISQEKSPPPVARITEAERERYFASSRDRIFEMAREKNNPMAWYLMSLEKNDMAILRHASDLGNVQALNTYATIKMAEAMELKETSPEKSEAAMRECFEAYKRAAESGDSNALNSLGICRQNGYGCAKDVKSAFKLFYKAAEKHHPEAVNNLGRFYLEGLGVEKDPVRALKCFRMSSTLGNVWGTINYATAVLMGQGCKPNESLAVEILEKSSSKGNAEAMDFLSECYSNGLGKIRKDSYKAMLWRLRARAARGDESAQEWLKVNKAEL